MPADVMPGLPDAFAEGAVLLHQRLDVALRHRPECLLVVIDQAQILHSGPPPGSRPCLTGFDMWGLEDLEDYMGRRNAVKKLMSALWVISLLVPAAAWAQPFPVNEKGVTMGHWHLNS